MVDLHPGDVLSYSAGSTQTGPLGFRKLRARPGLLASAFARWPELGAAFAGRTPMFINAYPSAIGAVASGIAVDTYLSPRVMSRALQLAALDDHPVILAAQPLLLAEALLRHLGAERPLPRTMLLAVGGYPLPRSLERMLVDSLAPLVEQVLILQGYGVAEVDAGCMMSCERDAKGRAIYYPRADVEVELAGDGGDELVLTLRSSTGEIEVERWHSGDRGERVGDGYVLWNNARLDPSVATALESWTSADWRRRTGYVRREGDVLWMQLRDGELGEREHEVEHWEFGRRFGFAWLDKPNWR